MESEVVARQRERHGVAPHLDELQPSAAARRPNRPAVPSPEHYHESAEKGHRTTTTRDPHQAQREPFTTPIVQRLCKVERQFRVMRIGLILGLIALAFIVVNPFGMGEANVGKRLMESEELKLVDTNGRPRVFLRMFSGVPVMQVLDAKGNPRLSLGLRFDDTPFIDLSDSSGMTRVRFQVTGGGEPAVNIFDGQGESTFSIN